MLLTWQRAPRDATCNSRCASQTQRVWWEKPPQLPRPPARLWARALGCSAARRGALAVRQCGRSVIQARCLRGVRAQTRALKCDGRRRDSARGTGRAAWRGLGLQAQLAAASVGLARRRRRLARTYGSRLRVRIAHWGRGEGVGDETESAITRSVFLVQQHNSQRSLLRFVIVARCYGVSTGPRACAHTHPSPVSFVTRCFERARSQPGHVANQIAAGRRCAVLPPSPSAFGRALRGRRGACESCTHLAVPSSAVRQAC